MATPDIFIVSAARTAIGSYGGSLKDIPLAQLATTVVSAALERGKVAPGDVGHLVMGNVVPSEPQDAYLSRVAAVNAGIPVTTPAFNVNRLCGSGLQAIVSALQGLQLGDAELAVAAGAESMSRGPYMLPAARWGARMGDFQAIDYTLGVLHDPFQRIHMGLTAENVADREGITRQMQDELAAESHRRAAAAIQDGRFVEQIVPIKIPQRKGELSFQQDEHVRAETTVEQLARMKPAFKPEGSVTAGNASGINDGAAAVVLATQQAVRDHQLAPMARIVSYGLAGVEPGVMGLGPIPASRIALQRAGLTVDQLDLVESNEAFAAQACAVSRGLDLDPKIVNPNGSGISLGHPIAATGAVMATKAVYELRRMQGRYALLTMCIGGGQGIALVIERV